MSKNKNIKILFWDIETSPILAWIWRPGYKINVDHSQVKAGETTDIICICYKWAHENKIHSLDWGINKQDSSKMLDKFSKVLEEADIIVAHNGDRFDIKHVNTQRLLNNQPPLKWPNSEDTLKQLKKHFNFPSFRLDYLAKTLVGAGKDKMCFQDWIDIKENKKQKALDKMIKYCKKDVLRLQQIFDKVSPYMEVKVSRAAIKGVSNHGHCPHCASDDIQLNGRYYIKTGYRQAYRCKSCSHAWRSSKTIKIHP